VKNPIIHLLAIELTETSSYTVFQVDFWRTFMVVKASMTDVSIPGSYATLFKRLNLLPVFHREVFAASQKVPSRLL
jgi:hypothetical protein